MEGKREVAMRRSEEDTEKMMKALHIVFCKQIAERNPKMDAYVLTRCCYCNIAFFDLDEESEDIHGPRLQELTSIGGGWIRGHSVNVISLKVIASDVGYPINVFGTVLGRDQVDHRCVHLFRRGRDNPQVINKPEDMLTLTGPCRGFQFSDGMFFEIDLKIRGDETTADRDLSKGILYQHAFEEQTVAARLTGWLSTVELVYAPILFAVEATIEVNILNGPVDVPFNGKISACVAGNKKDRIILYEYDDVRCSPALTGQSNIVGLARNLVAVPLEVRAEDIYTRLTVCFGDEKLAPVEVDIHYPMEVMCCKYGTYELEVKVVWTAIRAISEQRSAEVWERRRVMPSNTFMSWTWELQENTDQAFTRSYV